MGKQKLYFFAPLGNVDDSILNIKLKNGFIIDSMSFDQGSKIISAIVRIEPADINHWPHFSTVFSQSKIFFISNSFDFDLSKKDADGNSFVILDLYKFANNLVDKNLEISLRLLRLFKEGNIYTPFWCVYSINDEKLTVLLAGGGTSIIQYQDLFHLDDSEIENAQKFLDTTEMPLKFDYLKLAHENFELSFTVPNPSLSFLSLMIASEVLFNPGSGDITYRISRNFAVLLGNSIKNAKHIQKEISKLYRKRSSLVHSGKEIENFVGEENYVLKIRYYVRESIKKIISMNLSKDELLDFLNSKGFEQ
jgi:hypothetical protein